MNVLVASPVFEGMKYCFEEFLESVKNLDFPDYDVLIVDNSRTNYFFNELRGKGVNVIKDETSDEKNKLRLISSRNKIIDYAIEKGYDYILMMDSDVIAPKTILKDLLTSGKEIISGLYYNDFKIDGLIQKSPVCWCHVTPKEFEEIKSGVGLPPFVKSCNNLRRHLTKEEADSNKIVRVKIPSAGCMLIKRNVFEQIRYGLLDVPGNLSTGDDIYFCTKAEEKGFEIYCDTSIKCEHLVKGKFKRDEKGNLMHPLGE